MSDIVAHFQRGKFEEEYWIPAHNARRESALFKANKQFVRDECRAPCWICGGRENLEVHHVFEWAFWNALDPRKVTNILNAIEFYDDDYVAKAVDSKRLRARLDELEQEKPIIDSPDDLRNLVVLCRAHHRFRLTGVHVVTFPIWLAVSAVPEGGGILTREQILIAAERVLKIDQELAVLAENNYQPHR